jgi:hypothetical protein
MSVRGHQVPQLVDGINGERDQVVNGVLAALCDGLLRPWAGEVPALHQEQVDVVALPSEWPPVIGPVGQQFIDVPSPHRRVRLHALCKEAPFVNGEGLDP